MRPLARWTLAAVGLLVAASIVAELLLRFAPPAPVAPLSDVPLADTLCHPKRGWVMRASADLDYGGVHTTLNPLGLRGHLPPAGTRTAVLAVGDELTFGWGVGDADTYPAQLGELLRTQCPSCSAVVNAGVPGYATYQGLLLLREIAPALRPRVVVIAFHLNDALLDGRTNVTVTSAPGCPHGALGDWARPRSAAYGWLLWLLARPPREWWRVQPHTTALRYRRNVLALASEAHRFGAAVIYLNVGFAFPPPAGGARSGPRMHRRGVVEGDYHATMREAAIVEGSPLVEVMGPELADDAMLDEVHPSRAGYRRIAARVADTLRERAMLE